MKISKQTILTWWSIIKDKFPTILLEVIGYLTYLVSMLSTLFALVLALVVSILQLALMLLLTIGCLPQRVMSLVLSNLKYSGARTHQDSLQKLESRSVKILEELEKKTDTFSRYIKQSRFFTD